MEFARPNVSLLAGLVAGLASALFQFLAAGTVAEGRMRPVPVLVILDVRPGRLAIEGVLKFYTAALGGLPPMSSIADTRFLVAGQRRFGVWHAYPERYLERDLDAGRCVRGPPVEGGGTILDFPGGTGG